MIMSGKKKGFWFSFNLSCFSKQEENGRRLKKTIIHHPNVHEEYRQAFRTNSFIEICNKIQTRKDDDLQLIDEQTLISQIHHQPSKTHHKFITNYFHITLDASTICQSLLENIHVIKAAATSSFVQRNPFPEMEKFQELHAAHDNLLRKLTSHLKKAKKRSRIIKRGFLLIIGLEALLILATHTIGFGPGLVLYPLALLMMKKVLEGCRRRRRRIGELDMAARGVYIMMNDMDTVSRMVRKVEDEMEHRRFVGEMFMKKGVKNCIKLEREFQEEVEELERQVYLCFLDIDMARRLLVREMYQ